MAALRERMLAARMLFLEKIKPPNMERPSALEVWVFRHYRCYLERLHDADRAAVICGGRSNFFLGSRPVARG